MALAVSLSTRCHQPKRRWGGYSSSTNVASNAQDPSLIGTILKALVMPPETYLPFFRIAD